MTDRRDRSSVLERRACSGVRRKGAANKTKTTMTTSSSTTRRRMLGKSRQHGYLVEDSRVYCKRAFSAAACYSVSAESARRKRNRTRKTRRRRRTGGGGGDGGGREKGEEEADDREERSAGGGEEGKDPRLLGASLEARIYTVGAQAGRCRRHCRGATHRESNTDSQRMNGRQVSLRAHVSTYVRTYAGR